ncbi:hypothetical protein DKX38_017117 [Salix brachista]|uniref:Protein yippee-like n=1 Tax=Salix brachista TaxID=2182728 RepID=A0A5N5KV75_9ROSI|nr:hypothetical protein DKX38_017117 [Salix brachista]
MSVSGKRISSTSCDSLLCDGSEFQLSQGEGVLIQQCVRELAKCCVLRCGGGRRVNISVGPPEERLMLSGMHTVEDILCCLCGQLLGWKYVSAHDKNQKYKEGKFVLERWRLSEVIAEHPNSDARPGSSDGENP